MHFFRVALLLTAILSVNVFVFGRSQFKPTAELQDKVDAPKEKRKLLKT